MKKLSIIMPVYNEAKNLPLIVPKVLKADIGNLKKELIIIEGNSTDGSDKIVDKLNNNKNIFCYHVKRECGKGYKVRQGIKKATGDIILIQDADLEYNPKEYKELIQPIINRKTEFVLGSRHLGSGTWKIRKFDDAPFWGPLINIGAVGLNTIFNILNSVWLTDPQTMFKVFTKNSIKDISFNANYFDFDWELVTKLIKSGHKPIELPITYIGRSRSEGKKIVLRKDAFRNLWAIIKYKFFNNLKSNKMEKIIEVKCNNCSSFRKKIIKKIKYKNSLLKLVRCKKCSLVFLSPRFSNEFYKNIYKEDKLKNANYYKITYPEDKNSFRKKLNLALRYNPQPNKILDIGCATGTFLSICKEKNIPNIEGVELNKKSKKIAEGAGFKILDSIPQNKKEYDLINMGDVIEHFQDPKTKIRTTYNILKKNGLIMITTPDYNKLVTKLTNIKPEEHLFYYTKKTIKKLLNKTGYKILFIGNVTRFHPIKNFTKSSTFKNPFIKILINTILLIKLDRIVENLILKRLNNDILIIAKKE